MTEAMLDPIENAQHSVISSPGASPFRISGHVNKNSGGIVLTQVFINQRSGKTDRGGVHSLAIHEIPLARALQKLRGGSVELYASWVDTIGIPQVVGMTKMQANDELLRLRGNEDPSVGPKIAGKYLQDMGDAGVENMFFRVYGGKDGNPHRLFSSMQKIHEKWLEITRRAVKNLRRVTVEDIEECVAVCMPPDEADDLDAIALDQIGKPSLLSTNAADDGLLEYLTDVHGVNDTVASAFVGAIGRSKGDKLTKAVWNDIPGVTDKDEEYEAKRSGLMNLLGNFRAL